MPESVAPPLPGGGRRAYREEAAGNHTMRPMARPRPDTGAAPLFATRREWSLESGGTAEWESRAARKRGLLRVRAAPRGPAADRYAAAPVLGRLRLLNRIVSATFTVGSALFVAGAALAELTAVGVVRCALVYLAGGLLFTVGAYAEFLQCVNAPGRGGRDDGLVAGEWRWWSYEPMRVDWLSALLLLGGTGVFGVNLLDSLLRGLSAQQIDRLVWTPDMIGCTLFLISGQLAVHEVCHGRVVVRVRDLGWWIVVVNQLGAVLFMVSALADYTQPATDSLVNVSLANWATLGGALLFCAGGVLQAYERPTP